MWNVDDTLRKHITIYDDLEDNAEKQVDFLAFYCDKKARELHNPIKEFWWRRDNQNRHPTKRTHVYAQINEKEEMRLQYIDENIVEDEEEKHAPISILRRKLINNKRLITIYWKALKLYYSWYIDRLREYIKTYQWKTQRVDLCRDIKEKPNPLIIDWIKEKVQFINNGEWTYKWFWNKYSSLFIRIYDKTLDLHDDKDQHSRLYPERYMKECWRIETKLTLEYARTQKPIERLDCIKRDKEIVRANKKNRIPLKTAMIAMLEMIDYLPNKNDQYKILKIINEKIERKLKNFTTKDIINEEANNDNQNQKYV